MHKDRGNRLYRHFLDQNLKSAGMLLQLTSCDAASFYTMAKSAVANEPERLRPLSRTLQQQKRTRPNGDSGGYYCWRSLSAILSAN